MEYLRQSQFAFSAALERFSRTGISAAVYIAALSLICLAATTVMASQPAADLREQIAEMDFELAAPAGQKLPRGWHQSPLTGPDIPENARFPHYLTGEVSDKYSVRGKYSFKLSLNGGNLAYTYTEGIKASAKYDYLITGWVRTEGLQVARAQVRAALVDIKGEPIESALATSETFGAVGDKSYNKWTPFTLRLDGPYAQADSLAVSLALIQPDIWQDPSKRLLDRQDITGSCWFDDIRVYQLPRVAIQTTSAINTFMPGEPQILDINLEGLDSVKNGAVLTVRNSSSSVVTRRIISPQSIKNSHVSLELPLLPAGVYKAELEVSSHGSSALARQQSFAVLAPVPIGKRSNLVLDITDLDTVHFQRLRQMCLAAGAEAVKLPAWPDGAIEINSLLDELNSDGTKVSLVWNELPRELAIASGNTHGDYIQAIAEGEQWLRESILLMLSEHAGVVENWQLGSCLDDSFAWNSRLSRANSRCRGWVNRFTASNDMMLAWDGNIGYDLADDSQLVLKIDESITPRMIPQQLEEFSGKVAQVYCPVDDPSAIKSDMLDDFARRYVYARAAGVKQFVITPPWIISGADRPEPTELLLAARTLASYLGRASFIGSANIDEKRTALMFQISSTDAIMVVHCLPDGDDLPKLEMELPHTCRVVDLTGRVHRMKRSGNKAVLPDKYGTYLVTGCDPEMLQIRSSMKLSPDMLDSQYRPQEVIFSVDNPFGSPMVGELKLIAPPGWTITPDSCRFSIEPGGTWEKPLLVKFPFAAETSLHRIITFMEIFRGREMEITAPLMLRIVPNDLEMDTFVALRTDGLLEVQISVLNKGDTPVSFNCSARVPGRTQKNVVIQNLPSGDKIFKQFVFPSGNTLLGENVITGLREINGPRIINLSTPIH